MHLAEAFAPWYMRYLIFGWGWFLARSTVRVSGIRVTATETWLCHCQPVFAGIGNQRRVHPTLHVEANG